MAKKTYIFGWGLLVLLAIVLICAMMNNVPMFEGLDVNTPPSANAAVALGPAVAKVTSPAATLGPTAIATKGGPTVKVTSPAATLGPIAIATKGAPTVNLTPTVITAAATTLTPKIEGPSQAPQVAIAKMLNTCFDSNGAMLPQCQAQIDNLKTIKKSDVQTVLNQMTTGLTQISTGLA
jgi:hypothetical protein